MSNVLKKSKFAINQKIILIFLIIFLIVTSGVVFSLNKSNFFSNQNSENVATKEFKKIDFQYLELADSEEQRQEGLMFRRELCKYCGMLFVFEDTQNRSFWMQNTYVALDIIFIDDTGKIVNIAADATPLDSSKRYNSTKPSKYVLELNAGFSKEFGLEPGDRFNIPEMIANSKPFVVTNLENI